MVAVAFTVLGFSFLFASSSVPDPKVSEVLQLAAIASFTVSLGWAARSRLKGGDKDAKNR